MYSFSENSGGMLLETKSLVYQFLLQKFLIMFLWYSGSTHPLCLKFHIEVALSVYVPKPQVSSELVSPIRTYDRFPKVPHFKTVQNNKVVQTSTCHCFIFKF